MEDFKKQKNKIKNKFTSVTFLYLDVTIWDHMAKHEERVCFKSSVICVIENKETEAKHLTDG